MITVIVIVALVCLVYVYDSEIVTNHWNHWFNPWA